VRLLTKELCLQILRVLRVSAWDRPCPQPWTHPGGDAERPRWTKAAPARKSGYAGAVCEPPLRAPDW